jgi:predicted ATPase
MIKSIRFKNFKALRDSTLPLSQFTLIIGPNGSGKSTVFEALLAAGGKIQPALRELLSVGIPVSESSEVLAAFVWDAPSELLQARWSLKSRLGTDPKIDQRLMGLRVYSFQADRLCAAVELVPKIEMGPDGSGLSGVLDRLRDHHPERFDALVAELGRWIPEFDNILFDTPHSGHRAIALRTREGHKIAAEDLSQGTLLALAILTLSYIPDPPSILGLEEPDRGIHPRLLRDVRDAMYRLAYPESVGEKRPAVQVIATTHSPYMVDLFRDHPEEIVIAEKVEGNVQFRRLSDLPNVKEILQDAHLGDLWYSGILGGVPGEK